MVRTGGEITKKRILDAAEKLFSKKGFDATSVDEIARAARVNKALIYYHYKNKDDLILSLFKGIIEEVEEKLEQRPDCGSADTGEVIKSELHGEIEYLAGRKRILALMLSEALRSDRREAFLFRCAELVIKSEHGAEFEGEESGADGNSERQHMIFEFFTGFIPLVAFVILRDKYSDYFGHDQDKIVDDFVEAFARSHLAAKHGQD